MQSNVLTLSVPLNSFPLTSIVREGHRADTPSHVHTCVQLIYAQQGAALLETREGLVRLGPDRAAWIPSGEPHSVYMDKRFRYHSLYIDERLSGGQGLMVILVQPLLRELIVDAASWDENGLSCKQKSQRARLIIDEIRRAPQRPAGMRIPEDRRLSRICRALEQDPSNNSMLEDWAREIGASAKTLQRLFNAETGMSFQAWRIHLRMARALELHAQGWRLLDIALAVGYSGEGTYAQAFKKYFGHPPGMLRRKRMAGDGRAT